ncbi:hypothetical protein VSAK1_03830 [Vibrio mediterranei AK1]|nr:hypothetical protein VSAK1_03830 [Vibrio mediterranei AK1]
MTFVIDIETWAFKIKGHGKVKQAIIQI